MTPEAYTRFVRDHIDSATEATDAIVAIEAKPGTPEYSAALDEIVASHKVRGVLALGRAVASACAEPGLAPQDIRKAALDAGVVVEVRCDEMVIG